MNNRLQFRHHDEVFKSREDALKYINDKIRLYKEGLLASDRSHAMSLFAEPTVLLYENDADKELEEGVNPHPHLILAIGSVTNSDTEISNNRFCIIDIDKTENEISDLGAELTALSKRATIVPRETDTVEITSDETENGTFIGADVKTARSHTFNDDVKRYSNLMVTEDGLFIHAELTYDEASETFTFSINDADGNIRDKSVKLPNDYLVSGEYRKSDESLHFKMRSGNEVVVDCESLLSEWTVEGENSKTPIVLTKEEIGGDATSDDGHSHAEPWQDILKADVRIAEDRKGNILHKTKDGRKLYVDGVASNITYYQYGEEKTVQEALDSLAKIKLSTDHSNIIVNKADGFFASTTLSYVSKENKLIFKASNQDDTVINLNSFKLFEDIHYDPTTETLVITYIDGKDNTQIVRVPIGEMIKDWEWGVQNDGHTVRLSKSRNVNGNDLLSADVKVSSSDHNILTEVDHALYVRGTADNIRFDEKTNVKEAIDALRAKDAEIDTKLEDDIRNISGISAKLDKEIEDRISSVSAEEERARNVENKLFEDLATAQSDIAAEVARATAKEQELTDADTTEKNRAETAEQALAYSIETETARASNAEIALQTAIDNEKTLREQQEAFIEGKLNDEITRSIEKDNELTNAITAEEGRARDAETSLQSLIEEEKNRAIGAETTLQNNISDETVRASNAESALKADIESEKVRAVSAETALETAVNNETNRAQLVEQSISDSLNVEIERAKAAETVLGERIDGQTLTFNDTNTIDFDRDESDSRNINAKVILSTNINNIITSEANGLYSTVDINYDDVSNVITLVRNGIDDKRIQLSSGSLLDKMEYDPETRSLIITYTTAQGDVKTLSFPLSHVFNLWDVDNNNLNSAVKLYKKTITDESGNIDILSARVKILGEIEDINGNITYDDGGDNAIKIVGDCLYVSSSAMTTALEKAECANSELKSIENAVFGKVVENCGDGFSYEVPLGTTYITDAKTMNEAIYMLDSKLLEASGISESIDAKLSSTTESIDAVRNELKIVESEFLGMPLFSEGGVDDKYRPNEGSHYIISATSFNNADTILDHEVKIVNDKISSMEATIETLSGASDAHLDELNTIEASAGLNANGNYIVPNGCFISAATSLANADEILDNELCSLKDAFNNLMIGSDTPSTRIYVEVHNNNKHLKADVRLSHGNVRTPGGSMEDDELIIGDFSGETIESGVTYFTDTNVMRIVETERYDPDLNPGSRWNGVYLSNYWNCGKYYQPDTEQDEIELMEENGYKVEAFTDDSASASGYNYMNNVRQSDKLN